MAVLVGVFLSLAAGRRLNFDESLALRAGVLELAGEEAQPPFMMPVTLALGVLARSVEDPGLVFTVARLSVACVFLLLLSLTFLRFGLRGRGLALGFCFVLANGILVTHGLEFRYDSAILAGLLLVAASLADAARPWPFVGGLAVALLALHHLKGIFFAAIALALAVGLLRSSRRDLARLAAGVSAGLGAWIAVLLAMGRLGRWIDTLTGFASLAGEVSRVPPWEALGRAMLADLAWWALAAVAVGSIARLRSRRARSRSEVVALALAAAALAFPMVHPHAWPYMLAAPVPFLAAITVGRWLEMEPRGGRPILIPGLIVVAGLTVQTAVTDEPLHRAWSDGFAAHRAPEVQTLRILRAAASPEERILDPSGLAYFLRPCTRQWYLDSLFVERVARGTWMTELATGVPSSCSWALNTYRLGALPAGARAALRREFVLLPSALVLRRGDRRVGQLGAQGTAAGGELRSYW